jgi:hypothetical protein
MPDPDGVWPLPDTIEDHRLGIILQCRDILGRAHTAEMTAESEKDESSIKD